jgi:hypothetical protein
LRGIVSDIRSRGAKLIVVGNGSPAQAAGLAADLALDFPLYADPERVSYRAAGTRRDLAGALNPGVFAQAVRSWRRGHRQQGVQGDALQLGGTFVVAAGGAVVWSHRSAHAGDHPTPAEILVALNRATGDAD